MIEYWGRHTGSTRALLMITHDDLPDGVVDAQYRLRDGVLEREA